MPEFLLSLILSQSDKLIAVSLIIFMGIGLRITLQLFGQTWIQTKAHTTTILVLPIITYVITNVISGNIALSLGMVGALSIVRFRHPVRSPLELSVYFGAITMGIAASVSLQWLIFLVFAIAMAISTLILMNKASITFFSVPFFNASFSEGNSLSSISITSKEQIESLHDHQLLQSKVVSNADGTIVYHLASNNFNLLKEIEKDAQGNYNLISSELRR
tara:strand:+ start:154 stop:807 length:654 start_codon:yes stop_codon:yes gene_type:complete